MHFREGDLQIREISSSPEARVLAHGSGEEERGYEGEEADLILVNGSVYTADGSRTRAQAVAVTGRRIAFVGSSQDALRLSGPATRVIDLDGRMALPGFHDGHIHAIGAAYARLQVPLIDVSESRDLILRRLRRFVAANPDRPDYIGMGWDICAFSPDGPRRQDLDAVCPDKPVLLLSNDGHTAWANSAALQRAGIDRATPDPPGGTIVRDRETGNPSGLLKEPPAFRLVLRSMSMPDSVLLKNALMDFFRALSAEGVTSIFQPGIEFFDQEMMIAILAELEAEGNLPLRITAGYRCGAQHGLASVPKILAMKEKYRGPLVKTGVAKIFLDGVLEAHTARLLASYEDQPGLMGSTMWEPGPLAELITELDREHIQVHVHAVGDGAVRMALDAFERAIKINGKRDSRHTVAHMELADTADISRLKSLGALACLQPTWFHVNESGRKYLKDILGEDRSMRLYAMGSFLAGGVTVSCGSDYPVGSTELLTFRPLDGIEMGHTRRALGDPCGESYGPGECASLQDLIDGYTSIAAFQLFQEHDLGSIEPGKLADLVVLDQDIERVPAHRIHESRVLLTLLDGREVFRDPSL